MPATIDEDEGEQSDTAEADEEAAEETVDTPAVEEPPQKKEPSRWVQYQQIARAELLEETGSKPKLVTVNKRARAMYIEDGWSK